MVRLCDYDCIGFDLDHTLIQYRLDNLYPLVYKSFVQILVKKKGYDPCLLEDDFEDLKDFCLKGLVLDIDKGNFLKLRNDGFILRASHGTKQITRKDIMDCYGETSIWPEIASLKQDPVQQSSVFRVFDNYFDLPVSAVCARIVDVTDQKMGRQEKYEFWPDVIATLLQVFSPSSFSAQTGYFFPSIIKNTADYVKPCSKEVMNWLKCLRGGKQKVFLLTNSYIDYTTLLLNFAVGSDWVEMFDVVICMAGKPGFFKSWSSLPFYELDGEKEVCVAKELQDNRIYSRGNHKNFTTFLKKCTGKENPAVLYFGDSLKSDLYPTVKFGNWNVALVLEEMESEGMVMNLTVNDNEQDSVEDGPKTKRARHLDIEIEKDKTSVILSRQWGSFFIDDSADKNTALGDSAMGGDLHTHSREMVNGSVACSQRKTEGRQMNTFWGHIIEKYSDIAIPRIDFITGLPLDHSFDAFRISSGGFFPGNPISLDPTT